MLLQLCKIFSIEYLILGIYMSISLDLPRFKLVRSSVLTNIVRSSIFNLLNIVRSYIIECV